MPNFACVQYWMVWDRNGEEGTGRRDDTAEGHSRSQFPADVSNVSYTSSAEDSVSQVVIVIEYKWQHCTGWRCGGGLDGEDSGSCCSSLPGHGWRETLGPNTSPQTEAT